MRCARGPRPGRGTRAWRRGARTTRNRRWARCAGCPRRPSAGCRRTGASRDLGWSTAKTVACSAHRVRVRLVCCAGRLGGVPDLLAGCLRGGGRAFGACSGGLDGLVGLEHRDLAEHAGALCGRADVEFAAHAVADLAAPVGEPVAHRLDAVRVHAGALARGHARHTGTAWARRAGARGRARRARRARRGTGGAAVPACHRSGSISGRGPSSPRVPPLRPPASRTA